MRVACVAPPSHPPISPFLPPSVPLLRGIRPGRQVSVIIALSTLNRVTVIRVNEIMPFGSFFISHIAFQRAKIYGYINRIK